MAARSVKKVAGAANEPEMTVAQLAAEQAEQRKMLRALQRLTVAHVRECGALNRTTAATLAMQAKSLQAIEARFELLDRISHFLLKHGKKLGYVAMTAVISAYVGLLVQSWALHQDTTAHARDAADKAAAASSAVQEIPNRTVQELKASHAVAP